MEKDLGFEGLIDEKLIEEIVSKKVSTAYDKGVEKGIKTGGTSGAKKGTKELEKELEDTQIKLNKVTALVEEVTVKMDDKQVAQELTTKVKKVIEQKPVKVKANAKADIHIDANESQGKQIAKTVEKDINDKLAKKVKVNLSDYVSMDIDTLKEELNKVFNSKSFINAAPKAKATQKFIGLYASYLTKGGKEIAEYKAEYNNLVDETLVRQIYDIGAHEKIPAYIKHELELYQYIVQEVNNLHSSLTEVAKVQEQIVNTKPKSKSKQKSENQSSVLLGDSSTVQKVKQEINELTAEYEKSKSYFKDESLLYDIMIGKDGGVKTKTEFISEINSMLKEAQQKVSNEFSSGKELTEEEIANNYYGEALKQLRAAKSFGIVDLEDITAPYNDQGYLKSLYKTFSNTNPWSKQLDEMNDDSWSFIGYLIEQQERLNALQKNGGQDYVEILEKTKVLSKEINDVTTNNSEAGMVDKYSLDISEEEAMEKAKALEVESQKIGDIISSLRALDTEENKYYLESFGYIKNKISALEELQSKIDKDVFVYKNFQKIQRYNQVDIFSKATDKTLNKSVPEELERYWDQLEDSILDGSITGQEAIEKFNQKAQELGKTFDEVQKKWIDITQPMNNQADSLPGADTAPAVQAQNELQEKAKEAELDLYHMVEERNVTYSEIIDKIERIISLENKIKTLDESKSSEGRRYDELFDEYVDWQNPKETITTISERLKEIYKKYNGKISLINEDNIKEAAYLMDMLKGAGETPLLNKSQQAFFDNKKFKSDNLFGFVNHDSTISEEIDNSSEEIKELVKWFVKLEGVGLNENLRKQVERFTKDIQSGTLSAEEYAKTLLKIFDVKQQYSSTPSNQEVLSGADSLNDKLSTIKEIAQAYDKVISIEDKKNETDEGTKKYEKLESDLESAESTVRDFESSYSRVLVQLTDGSKVDIPLDEEFSETIGNILSDMSKITDITLVSPELQKAIDGYEVLGKVLDRNIAKSGNKAGTIKPGDILESTRAFNVLESCTQEIARIERAIESVKAQDPDGMFGDLSKIEKAENLLAVLRRRVEEIPRENAFSDLTEGMFEDADWDKFQPEFDKMFEAVRTGAISAEDAVESLIKTANQLANPEVNQSGVLSGDENKSLKLTEEQILDICVALEQYQAKFSNMQYVLEKETATAYDELSNKLKTYVSLKEKEHSGNKLTDSENNLLKEIQDEIDKATAKQGKYANATGEAAEAQDKFNKKLKEYSEVFGNKIYNKLKSDLDKAKGKTNKTEDYYNEIKLIEKELNRLNVPIDFTKPETLEELTEVETKVKKMIKNLGREELQVVSDKKINDLYERANKLYNQHTAAPKNLREEIKNIISEAERMKNGLEEVNKTKFDELDTRLSELKSKIEATGKTGDSLGTKIKKKFKDVAAYFATYVSIQDAIQVIRQGFETIKEYDVALTEMNKVSDESIRTLKEFQKESFALADSVGTTAQQIQNSTADWMRLGESLEEAKQSAQDANILFNVSEFSSIDEATESLVSMSQAYKELGKGEIIDVVNNLGNNFAISTDGLATALQNSASALKTAQNDFFEAAALTTAANTVVQDPDKVGAGLRTIALRLTGTEAARDELQALGEDVDDFVVTTTSKLDQQIKDLTKTQGNFGVSLLDMNGNYRSTYEILLDIAKVWDKIAEEDLVTGENRQNALLEMMANFSLYAQKCA